MAFPANAASEARTLTLPAATTAWDSYAVVCNVVNDNRGQVPNFNHCSVIASDFTASQFTIRGWNDSTSAQDYRVAIIVYA